MSVNDRGLALRLSIPMTGVVGRAVPGDVKDRSGRVLVRGGEVLTAERVDLLSGMDLWIDESWMGCEQWTEKRQHVRHPWQVRTVAQIGEGSKQRPAEIVTEDLSCGGFSFNCKSFIHPGSPIALDVEMGGRKQRLIGTVRYCLAIEGLRHRVGVHLTGHENIDEPSTPSMPEATEQSAS